MKIEDLIEELRLMGIRDDSVLKAMARVDRKFFVAEKFKDEAYGNYPLPLIKGQTISQPYTVALMLEALELKRGDKVLEVGTGSGWNAALISEITKSVVYSTEIVKELVKLAKENFKRAGVIRVKVFNVDGSKGLKKYGPYSKIIVTAACPKLPEVLLGQLKDKGVLVAPVGPAHVQEMVKIKKVKDGLDIKRLGNFQFVRLTGEGSY